MKTYRKYINAYLFNELSEKAKEKAKESYLQDCHEPTSFSNDLRMNLIEDCGLCYLKTYYSLNYCQGDGLCLYGKIESNEIFDNPKFRKIALNGLRGGQIKSVTENLYKIDFTHSGRYYYSNSTTIEVQENSYDITDKQYDLLKKVEQNIKDWYFDFCDKWEKIGYDYFYNVSDDEIQEISEVNDWYYDVNGNLLSIIELEEVA